jgi:hypothetical protein
MDLPPEPQIQSIEVIEQRLVDCGLNKKGFSIEYSELLQAREIVIGKNADASVGHFPCIHTALGLEFVTFEDAQMGEEYRNFSNELARPQILEYAKNGLAEVGLLEGFPERAKYKNDKRFAEAIEVHCGLDAGSVLKEVEGGLTLQPDDLELDSVTLSEKYRRLIAAVIYAQAKGDIQNFGFVGNEAYQTDVNGDPIKEGDEGY